MSRSVRVLYVEDDPSEHFFMETAARRADKLETSVRAYCVSTGQEAIRYLIGEDQYADRKAFPFPSLIITDLKMSEGDGFDVLEFLLHNSAWSVVPRIVLSNSDHPDDVKKAFMLGATAYHLKGIQYGSTLHCLDVILAYWQFSIVPQTDATGRLLSTDACGKVGERYPQPRGAEIMQRVVPKSQSTAPF